MTLCIINPNTSAIMSAKIDAAARAVAGQGDIVTLTSRHGPASIEGHFDEALAIPGILEHIQQYGAGEARFDGYLIACFGDPGLAAARELASVPVLGIAEAAMHTACLIGSRFSIVTTLSRTIPIAERLVRDYGLTGRCARIRACDLPVAALEETDGEARRRLLGECRRALAEDGSDTLVLGCAGMADLTAWLGDKLGVPVVDGVAAGVRLLESLTALQLNPAKRHDRATPILKPISGAFAHLSPTHASRTPT